jgi:hypothetical protein
LFDDSAKLPELVPVFPLPDVVFFPRALLPLHVFEPRYRSMVSDSLAGAQVIAVSLLKDGFAPLYYTLRAPIHPVVGVGRIVAHERLDDGRFNILLRGDARAQVLEELNGRAYRFARIRILRSGARPSEALAGDLRRELRRAVEQNVLVQDRLQEQWRDLFDCSIDLDDLTDLIASGMPTDAELRQFLLAEPNASIRARMLCQQIRTLSAIQHRRQRAETGRCVNLN